MPHRGIPVFLSVAPYKASDRPVRPIIAGRAARGQDKKAFLVRDALAVAEGLKAPAATDRRTASTAEDNPVPEGRAVLAVKVLWLTSCPCVDFLPLLQRSRLTDVRPVPIPPASRRSITPGIGRGFRSAAKIFFLFTIC